MFEKIGLTFQRIAVTLFTGILFLLGCIPQKINRAAALAGCFCGVAVIGWISLAGLWNLPGPHLHTSLAIVLGTTVIFLVGFLATIAVGNRQKDQTA